VIQSQPRQTVVKTLSQKNPSQRKGWWSGSRCRPRIETPVLHKQQRKQAIMNVAEDVKKRNCRLECKLVQHLWKSV
jgi:hypothetical protein